MTFKGKSQSAEANFTPFTAHAVKKYFGAATATLPAATSQITFGRKSDGSQARFITVPSPVGGKVGQIGNIFDVGALAERDLEPFIRSVSTYYLSHAEVTQRLESEACPGDIDSLTEHAMILGYEVVELKEKHDFHAGDYVTVEKWVAPDLACFALSRIERLSSGPWNEETVTSLTIGEPPESMFEVPSGYVERSPGEAAAAYAAEFGHSLVSGVVASAADTRYYNHRAPAQ